MFKPTQYVVQEKAITAADRGGIRERIFYGLRLLNDPDAFSPGSTQLRPGCAVILIQAATARGLKLSEREIQYRLRAARAYKTEAEIAQASAEFQTWWGLIGAHFPAYEVPDGEPPADYRTARDRKRDAARLLAALSDDDAQETLFPLDQYEPTQTELKELGEYMDQQDGITARFVEVGRRRHAYYDRLVAAAAGDLSMLWSEAHNRLAGGDQDGAEQPEAA